MATSYAVYPASPSHFMRSPNSSFCGGDWPEPASNAHMSNSPQALLHTSSPRRPKLSLNTSCSLSLGRASGLRLDALSAVSPTVRNTYANGFEDAQHSCQSASNHASTTTVKLVTQQPTRLGCGLPAEEFTTPTSQIHDDLNSQHTTSACSLQKMTTAKAAEDAVSEFRTLPYIHPSNLRSILANSPLLEQTLRKRPLSSPTSLINTPVTLKKKRVCFAPQLVEEISTATYIARHFDLPSRTPSPGPCPAAVSLTVNGSTMSLSSVTETTTRDSKIVQVDKISRKHEELEEDNNSALPQTPVCGSKRRQRDWVWTLSPIGREDNQVQNERSDANFETQATEDHPKQPSVTTADQIVDALKPTTSFCDTVKDMASGKGIIGGVRELVDGYLGLSE